MRVRRRDGRTVYRRAACCIRLCFAQHRVGKLRMEPLDPSKIVHRLVELRSEHRDLDAVIARLVEDAAADELTLKRLKKRKLVLKDSIAKLESRLIPDLDA